jgi:ABC-2 type transport system permease protein
VTRGPAFLAIAVKDATETWRDGRFRWAAGLLFLLLVAAIAGGAQHQSRIAQQHADAQAAERDAWLDKGDMNPHAAAHYGAFVFKPVQPLSAIDPGLDPFLGVFVFLEAHKQQLARHRPIEDAAPTRRLGLLTPATAALVLIPLLVVSLTFSSFAGERDQGTLRPLLALGISRWSLLVGKALGAMLPLIVVMIPAAIVAAAFVFFNRPADLDAPVGARAFGLLLVYASRRAGGVAGLVVCERFRDAATGHGDREGYVAITIGNAVHGRDRKRKGEMARLGHASRSRHGAIPRRRVRVDHGSGERGGGRADRIGSR